MPPSVEVPCNLARKLTLCEVTSIRLRGFWRSEHHDHSGYYACSLVLQSLEAMAQESFRIPGKERLKESWVLWVFGPAPSLLDVRLGCFVFPVQGSGSMPPGVEICSTYYDQL